MQAMEEELKMLRSGVATLLHDTTPVPGANAQLRRFCADLGRLLVASRPAEGYDEGPGAPKSRWQPGRRGLVDEHPVGAGYCPQLGHDGCLKGDRFVESHLHVGGRFTKR